MSAVVALSRGGTGWGRRRSRFGLEPNRSRGGGIMKLKWFGAGAFLSLLLGVVPLPAQEAGPFDVLITGGRIIDGTGNPWFSADVGVRGGKIVAVGDLTGATAARTIDAE